jgi:hypothetical protein
LINTAVMKSKSGKSSNKKGKKMTEAEKEDALVALIVRIIVENTLKEVYGEKQEDKNDNRT